MRLISCYIENFGGLKNYRLDFDRELTLIKEPNGFGKTTLAEFIKAMFYGLPKSNIKSALEKSPRRKYLPWQGGNYGGWLIFEHEGVQYRINRKFGQRTSGDHFALYEGESQKESHRFSENIGMELFGLDADSFERSTYLPQVHGDFALSTDSIQAKLGNLVEDTNDINNFDKAVSALRKKRMGYALFRGDSGSIAQTQAAISRLQTECDELAPLPEELCGLRQEELELRHEIGLKESAIEKIRSEITRSSEAAAVLTVQKHWQALKEHREKSAAELAALRSGLPERLPGPEELDGLLPVYSKLSQLSRPAEKSADAAEAEKILAENAGRFSGGYPEEQAIRSFEDKNEEYISAVSSAGSLCLLDNEERQLEELEAFFASGCPSEEDTESLKAMAQELVSLRQKSESRSITPGELEELHRLAAFLAPGPPSEEELKQKQEELNKISALQQENLRLAAPAAQQSEKPAEKSRAFLPLLISGIIAVLGAGALVAFKYYIPAAVCFAAALILIVAAAYLRLSHMIRNEMGRNGSGDGISPENRQRIEQNSAELERLSAGLETFCSLYIASEQTPGEKLTKISENLHLYKPLRERADAVRQLRMELAPGIQELDEALSRALEPYYPGREDFLSSVHELENRRREYAGLKAKLASLELKKQEMLNKAEELGSAVGGFLSLYYAEVPPEDYGNYLSLLRRDCDACRRAEKLLEARDAAERKRLQELEENEAMISRFNEAYSLSLSWQEPGALQELRDAVISFGRLSAALEAEDSELKAYSDEHSAMITAPPAGDVPDTEGLKAAEASISAELRELKEKQLNLQERCRSMELRADSIPEKELRLRELKEQLAGDMKKRDLLDITIDMLEKAREDLNTAYLGGIKESFGHYLSLLGEEGGEGLILNTDLELRLEREGEAREMGYFSAGQTDILMFCMRLALVDSLFKEAKPFIILDDPFVNLDDRHTEEALKLLNRLKKEQQIVYLCCNSSRCTE